MPTGPPWGGGWFIGYDFTTSLGILNCVIHEVDGTYTYSSYFGNEVDAIYGGTEYL
jgi:hypothetical protein